MNSQVQQAKAALRAKVRAELEKFSPTEREAASLEACLRLEQQEIWQKARSILFYAPMVDEPDIWKLVADSIALGKTVALPRFVPEKGHYEACEIKDHARDIRPGKFGIREPAEKCGKIALNRLDLALAPGIAFDLHGRRLGRGRGFYDRLLAEYPGTACGVAFDQQIVGEIPVEPHDAQLSCILTPTRWQWVAGPRAVLK